MAVGAEAGTRDACFGGGKEMGREDGNSEVTSYTISDYSSAKLVHRRPPIACLAGMEPMSPFVPDFVILPTPTLPTLADETWPKTLAGGM